MTFDPVFTQFAHYLKTPKNGNRTERPPVVCDEDIIAVMGRIDTLKEPRRTHLLAYLLTAVYTGQRPQTLARLTRADIESAMESGILQIPANIDKTRYTHFAPFHDEAKKVCCAWLTCCDSNGGGRVFNMPSMQKFLMKTRIPLKHGGRHFCIKDARKYYQQKSDELGIPREIVNFVMAHETGGVVNKHYSRLTPPIVINAMKKWESVKLTEMIHNETWCHGITAPPRESFVE